MFDVFELGEDNDGDFVHIQSNIVTINDNPEKAEPDLFIWREPIEFATWIEETFIYGS
jgi:hypothetical protein